MQSSSAIELESNFAATPGARAEYEANVAAIRNSVRATAEYTRVWHDLKALHWQAQHLCAAVCQRAG
jgi:hypothetical protein